MILAYCISAQDDDSYMLGEDTYKPKESAGFYDWRFGKTASRTRLHAQSAEGRLIRTM